MMRTGARNIQQISAAAIVLAVAAVVAWMSYTREPAAAFLFPRVIAIVFFILACWNFARAAMGLILGPIAESNFLQGSLIAGAQDGPLVYFLTGYLNLFLISLTVASIAFAFWSTTFANRKAAKSNEVEQA